MKKRRLLGILLSLALMMTMMPALAFAEDAEIAETKSSVSEDVSVQGSEDAALWVGGHKVTASGKVEGEGIVGNVSVAFDGDDHATLTLDGATITGTEDTTTIEGTPPDPKPNFTYNIYSYNKDLTIVLKGENTVDSETMTEDPAQYAIYARNDDSPNGRLKIEGPGSLAVNSQTTAIFSFEGCKIDNCNIIAISVDSSAIVANKECEINGGVITATAGAWYGIDIMKDFTITECKMTAVGAEDGINSWGKVTFKDCSTNASGKTGRGVYGSKGVVVSGGTLNSTGGSAGVRTNSGDVNINDVSVNVTGSEYGIYSLRGGVTINSDVCATSIGKGICAYRDVTINRGTVTATGTDSGICANENVTVNGGDVEATATGIGASGIYAYNNVTVKGGNVAASGKGKGSYSGIAAKKKVIINDGTVTASSNYAGIVSVDSNDITVTGGSVKANGGYDGIWSSDGKVAITGGNVSSVGKTDCGICSAEAIIGADAVSVESAGAKYAFAGYDDASDKYIGNKVKNSIVGTGWANTEGTGVGEGIGINTAGRALNYKKVHFQTLPDTTPVGSVHNVSGSDYVVTAANTVSLVKAKSKKSITLPATVTIDGKVFDVTGINAKAFKGKKVRTLTVKTKGLTKASVKGSLKGSKVRTVKVKVGKKKENKKFVKKYKKIFTKKNAGKKVSVRR